MMTSKKGKILVVDDNAGIRQALKILLPMYFDEVEAIPSPATLVATLERFRPDVVLLDMNFHTDINTGNEGLYWAGELKKMAPDLEIVLVKSARKYRVLTLEKLLPESFGPEHL
jgi:CheY-like chemotaxis protein